jgi:hypothetical protein
MRSMVEGAGLQSGCSTAAHPPVDPAHPHPHSPASAPSVSPQDGDPPPPMGEDLPSSSRIFPGQCIAG